jgi:nitroreductase
MEHSTVLEAILKRTSVRNFKKSKRVPEEILTKILLAGITAPSAGNIQPRTFIVVKDEDIKERLFKLCEGQTFMKAAPVWVVICIDLERHLKASRLTGVEYDYTGILPYTFGVLDTALSLENMVIAAEAFGLGSVIIGSTIEHPEKVKEILRLPKHCLALCILCIGYPKRKMETRPKWNRSLMVCQDHYSGIQAQDVSEYWKKFISSNLKRSGKELSDEMVEKFCSETTYGKLYAKHYKEEFVKVTNKKLTEFLRKQELLKD